MRPSQNDWWLKIHGSDARQLLIDDRNEIKICPMCNSSIEDRIITIYAELAQQLYAIYCWCGKNKCHEFNMKNVRHLLDHNGYTRFNDLIRCSNGILYRPTDEDGEKLRRGHYGIHMARAKEFFSGDRSIHLQISLNPITREKKVLKDVFMGQIPALRTMIDSGGMYDYEAIL